MTSELSTLVDNGKIIRVEETKKAVFHPETRSASLEVIKTTKEKILSVVFNSGFGVEEIIIRNLGDMRGNITKEQAVMKKISEGRGHLMLLVNGEQKMIRISNIISVETKWVVI